MNIKLRGKLLSLSVIPLVISIIATTFLAMHYEKQMVDQNIEAFRNKLIDERKNQLIEVTQVAQTIIANAQKTASGNPDQAVKDALRDIRFGQAGYFFIYDRKGVNVFHAAKPELEGRELIGLTDPTGKKIIVGLLEAAQRGGGFFSFYFQKPGTSEQIEKIGYSTMIHNGEWMLGTGVYIDDIEATVADFRSDAQAALDAQTTRMIIVGLLISLVTALIVTIIAQRLVRTVSDMLDNLNDIADGEGDLTQRLNVSGHDEIALLGEAFNRFVDKLQHTIKQVTMVTHEVCDSARTIDSQTEVVASRLDTHNHETEQVVTAVTEMSSAAQEVAQNATQVSDATHAATDDAQNAQQRVQYSITAMHELVGEMNASSQHINSLNEQSQKITNVLSVIGGIAEQTNLLALNAAIEAARAGEQGRGFAVVADEVRTLASRTQSSTHEIKEMLDELQAYVTQAVQGMENSNDTCQRASSASDEIGSSIDAVGNAIVQINDMTSYIASAASEQNAVTEDIHRNLVSIRDIIGELLNASNESSVVATKLNSSGEQLKQLVGQFKV